MKVFHCTYLEFDIISLEAVKSNSKHKYLGDALYFSESIEVAKLHGDQLFSLDVTGMNFVELNAKGNDINFVSENLVTLIAEKSNIKIINVSDSKNSFRNIITVNSDDPSYPFTAYYSVFPFLMEFRFKDFKEREEIAKSNGIVIPKFGKRFSTMELTIEKARMLSSLGYVVRKIVRKAPLTSTIYIISSPEIISKITKDGKVEPKSLTYKDYRRRT